MGSRESVVVQRVGLTFKGRGVMELEGDDNPAAAVMDVDEGDGFAAARGQPNRQSGWDLIALARHLIAQGNPSSALHAVVMAIRCSGGDAAVLCTLNRARELYQNKRHAYIAVEELASLLAECAIAEAQPGRTGSLPFNTNGASPLTIPKFDENSILAENGRRQLVLDAFEDGSSFICLRCGGLISNLRKDEHLQYWCNTNDSTQ